jgi:hypothetical protein
MVHRGGGMATPATRSSNAIRTRVVKQEIPVFSARWRDQWKPAGAGIRRDG